MHLSRTIAIRVTLSAVLTVMNLLIGASVLRSTANQTVFPLVITLVLFAAATLVKVWHHIVAIPAPAKSPSGYVREHDLQGRSIGVSPGCAHEGIPAGTAQ